jgi:hypothetical protein
MTTYADAFRELCAGMGFDGGHSGWIASIFASAARDWGGRPVVDGPGFPCGITSNGDPFECSVSLVEEGPCVLRFIAQPGGSAGAARAAFDVVREHAAPGRHGEALAEFAEFFVRSQRDDFRGNFTAWVGAGIDGGGDRALKLYLNPWSVRDPAELLGRLLALAGCGRSCEEALPGVLAVLTPTSWMNMLGLNVPGSAAPQAKTYFVVPRISGREGHTRLTVLGALEGALSDVIPPDGREGELHVAAVCSRSPHASLDLKIGYRVLDFFQDDAEALAAAERHPGWTPGSRRLLGRLRSLAGERGGARRRVTFLGVGQRKCDVYLV